MPHLRRYVGGLDAVEVALPSGRRQVFDRDADVEVLDGDAAALDRHPEFRDPSAPEVEVEVPTSLVDPAADEPVPGPKVPPLDAVEDEDPFFPLPTTPTPVEDDAPADPADEEVR